MITTETRVETSKLTYEELKKINDEKNEKLLNEYKVKKGIEDEKERN